MAAIELDVDLIARGVTLLSTFGGGLYLIYKMGRMTERFELLITQHGNEISALRSNILSLGEVVIKQAVQNTRLDGQAERMASIEAHLTIVEKHIDELRHGEGLIKNGNGR